MFLNDFMPIFFTLWQGGHDLRLNRSQLVPIEVKISPTYVKQSTCIVGYFKDNDFVK